MILKLGDKVFGCFAILYKIKLLLFEFMKLTISVITVTFNVANLLCLIAVCD